MPATAEALVTVDADGYRHAYDHVPFGFRHGLHRLPMFQPDALTQLAERYADSPSDYFVAGSAPTPGTKFYDVRKNPAKPHEALAAFGTQPSRVLLKRLEKHDSGFRDLIDELFRTIVALRGPGFEDEKIIRLESAVFISSAVATTPFHFDPEITHFFQIEGPKQYHVFAPSAVAESALERFYVRGSLDIGQLDLAACDRQYEHVFELEPGLAFHQPQDAPHWVQTGTVRSVSYAVSFETNATRDKGRVHAANRYLRALGMHPKRPGADLAAIDHAKAAVMQVMTPMRHNVGKVVRTAKKMSGR